MKPSGAMKRLGKLSARRFENFVFDILLRRGLLNLRWRTPGADGGRDIEGVFTSIDFAGFTSTETWYVECKRVKVSIDWPTVRAKVAYAQNHVADSFLLCTTSSASPTCKDEIARWNNLRSKPSIRVWEGADLDQFIRRDPMLRVKYSLGASTNDINVAALPLVRHLVKTVNSVHGEQALTSGVMPSVECAAAIAEYLAQWLDQSESASSTSPHAFDLDRDSYAWCSIRGHGTDIANWNAYATRAILTILRFHLRNELIVVEAVAATAKDPPMLRVLGISKLPNATRSAIQSICLMADLEFWQEGTALLVGGRRL